MPSSDNTNAHSTLEINNMGTEAGMSQIEYIYSIVKLRLIRTNL